MIEYPLFSELNDEEKDRVIQLILMHLGRQISAYKWDGSSDRIISLEKDS